jgi:hypothetical protein
VKSSVPGSSRPIPSPVDPVSGVPAPASAGLVGRKGLLRIALAPGVADPEIVLGVLIEILGGNPVAAHRRFPCQGDIAFEDLPRGATDSDIRAVAFKSLIGLWKSWLLSELSI